ncbi:hypothetical protein Acsp04_32510 [Actinomadura sp. NBRC 104425]|nr:hypothetical protein Acsp04_32510 [Actinomadura sp. NBRC 104425]
MGPETRVAQAEAGWERFRLLLQLMLDLREVGRGSSLVLPAIGQPVLYMRVRSGRRSLAVLGGQEPRGGWSYLWDGRCQAPADGTKRAARQIAAVEW